MSVNAPSLPVDDLRDRAVELLEEGVSSATEVLAPLAERVTEEAEDLIDDLEKADAAERRTLLALVLLAVGVALVLVVVARRRRSEDADHDDED